MKQKIIRRHVRKIDQWVPFPEIIYKATIHLVQVIISATTYEQVPRQWLCYSSAAYCEPCRLFSPIDTPWRTGVKIWQNLSYTIGDHCNWTNHIQTCAVYKLWDQNSTIDKNIKDKRRFQATFWKIVLQRIFKISLVLAKNGLSFRGYRENFETYNGNFLALVHLLADYDNIMKQVLGVLSESVKHFSPTIQNEIISFLLHHILLNIKEEMNCILCFLTDKLSITIRTIQFRGVRLMEAGEAQLPYTLR